MSEKFPPRCKDETCRDITFFEFSEQDIAEIRAKYIEMFGNLMLEKTTSHKHLTFEKTSRSIIYALKTKQGKTDSSCIHDSKGKRYGFVSEIFKVPTASGETEIFFRVDLCPLHTVDYESGLHYCLDAREYSTISHINDCSAPLIYAKEENNIWFLSGPASGDLLEWLEGHIH